MPNVKENTLIRSISANVASMNAMQWATLFFLWVLFLAHLFVLKTSAYHWTQHTISDLASQGYAYKSIMQAGFLGFGLGVAWASRYQKDLSWKRYSVCLFPLALYGLSVAFSGIFCAKPFYGQAPFSELDDALHSFFAQFAGVSFTLALLGHIYLEEDPKKKRIHSYFLLAVLGLSATFGMLDSSQGLVQRVLYLVSLFWLFFYPNTRR